MVIKECTKCGAKREGQTEEIAEKLMQLHIDIRHPR